MLLHGYRYYSDEMAVVEPSTEELHPYPRPITVRNPGIFPDLAGRQELWLGPSRGPRDDPPVWFVHPEDVAPGCIGKPVPIRYIVFPNYNPDAVAPQLVPLSPGQAIPRLMDNSINLGLLGTEGFHLVARLVEGAQCFSLTTNGLDETTSLITELIGE